MKREYLGQTTGARETQAGTERRSSARPTAHITMSIALRNLLEAATGQAGAVALLVASGIVLPRLTGVADYGRYTGLVAVVHVLLPLTALGLAQVQLRYLSPLTREPAAEAALTLGSTIWGTRLLLSLLVALASVVWLSNVARTLTVAGAVPVLSLLCFLRAAQEAQRNMFLSVRRVGTSSALRFLEALLSLPLVILGYQLDGLLGAFAALLLVHATLFLASSILLRRALPLSLRHFRWSVLRPYWGYSVGAFLASYPMIVQGQYGIFAVAHRVSPIDAGILAVALQLFVVPRGLFLAAQTAVVPLLAELDSAGDLERLRVWGETLMRYTVAALVLACLCWRAIGEALVAWVWGPAFGLVHDVGAVLLLSLLFYCAGAIASGLLAVRERAAWAAVSVGGFTVVLVAGLEAAIAADGPKLLSVGVVYAGASLVFLISSVLLLRAVGGLQLPMLRVALLALPSALALPWVPWPESLPLRAALLAFLMTCYALMSVGFRWLPWSELGSLREILRNRGATRP